MGFPLVDDASGDGQIHSDDGDRWSMQPDQKTIYFKLDPDARWSDGRPITADDYVFTWKMMQSKYIVDPFYNTYREAILPIGGQDRRLHAADCRYPSKLAAAV